MKRKKTPKLTDAINLFNNSKEYKDTMEQIELLKELIAKIKNLPKEDVLSIATKFGFDKKRVITLIENIIEFSNMSQEEKAEFDMIAEFCAYTRTKEEILIDYEKNLILWYTYMFIFQLNEEYEVCNKLQRVINCETTELINNLNVYFDFDEYDEEFIAKLQINIRTQIFE